MRGGRPPLEDRLRLRRRRSTLSQGTETRKGRSERETSQGVHVAVDPRDRERACDLRPARCARLERSGPRGRDLPDQPRRRLRNRPPRSGTCLHARRLGAARHRLRAPHDVSGQAAAGGFPASARGGGGAAEALPRSPYVHVHVAQRLSLQRRNPRPGECLRSRDQPHARPGRCLTGRPAGPRHRRRRRGAGREDARCSGRRRPREHARRPVHAPGVRLRGTDDDAVLLRRAADAARRSRGSSSRSPARGRTTSPSTGPASASSSGATASTAAGGHTMSTDSTSTSGPRRRRRC